MYSKLEIVNFDSGDHSQEPVPIAISLISNVYEELFQADKNENLEELRKLQDDVTEFNELSCGSEDASLGRYCSIDTLPIIKRLKAKVETILMNKVKT